MHFLSCAGELNHHGLFVCESLYNLLGDDFKRITTQEVDKERISLGYDQNAKTEYNTVQTNLDKEFIYEAINWCDVLDFGAAPIEYLEEAVKQDKVVFIRIERLFKEGRWKLLFPNILLKYYRKYIKYRNNSKVFFLCVSAYAASDLSLIGIKNDRVLQWAYCPEFLPLPGEVLDISNKKLELLWCGRMIGWKHPEAALSICDYLNKNDFDFHMTMIGNGSMYKYIESLIEKLNLQSRVDLLGAVDAKSVRSYMIKADVFFATSDKNEGWGVVINEAMNSGCVVFASDSMGAAPILIENGKNGFLFKLGHELDVAKSIIDLSKKPDRIQSIKKSAYETIMKEFSPDVYAETYIRLANLATTNSSFEFKRLGSKAIIR